MKKIKAGTMKPERRRLFEDLMAQRSTEHTEGRRKVSHEDENLFTIQNVSDISTFQAKTMLKTARETIFLYGMRENV